MREKTYSSAALDMVLSNRLTVVHGVERRDFIHSHWRHFQDARNFVHDADTSPAVVLALTEIEKRHDGGFFVLAGVAREDFFDQTLVLLVEFEGNRGIVVVCVAVLKRRSSEHWVEAAGLCGFTTYHHEVAAGWSWGDREGAALRDGPG